MSGFVDDHGIPRSPTDVFISYNKADRAKVAMVAHALSAAGITSVWDQDLVPGQSYADMIQKLLQQSTLVLVCWSASSISSEWVVSEAEYARARKILIACKIEQCKPFPPFNTFQATNLSHWDGDANDPAWKGLVKLIKFRTEGEGASSETRPDPATKTLAPKRSGIALYLAVAVFAFVAGGVAVVLFLRSGLVNFAS